MRTLTTRAAVAVGVATMMLAAGCNGWRQPGFGPANGRFNPDETGLTIDNVATLEHSWTQTGGVSAIEDGKVIGSPTTSNGVELIARDVVTGEVAWSHILTPPSPSAWATHSPVVSGDQVWVGYMARTGETCTFGLARVGLADGVVIEDDRSFAPGELVPFGGDRVALDQRVYYPVNVGDDDTCMYNPGPIGVAEGGSGDLLWVDEWGFGMNRILVVGDGLYMIGGSLWRFDAAGCGAATCQPAWSASPTSPGVSDHYASSPAGGPLVAVASTANPGETALYTIDPATGAKLSSTPLPFTAWVLALADGIAFVAGDDRIAAFDVAACAAGTCGPLWQGTLGGDVTWSDNGIAVAGGVVYVGRGDGTVEAFAAEGCGEPTCPNVTSVSTSGTVFALAVAQGRLFVDNYIGTASTSQTVTVFAPTS